MTAAARPHPSSPAICWRCWGWGGEYVLVHTSDDGQTDWEQAECQGCRGSNLEADRLKRMRLGRGPVLPVIRNVKTKEIENE